MKIGVFDSGVGGLSVSNAIQEALPGHQIILREDKENLPYGTKTPEQLLELVMPILQDMVEQGCEIIVIACNTVTTSIINDLRVTIDIPLIGMEPMIKPAAENTESGIIAVFATPTTLASKRYDYLKQEFAKDIRVIEPDCSTWSYMIENNQIDEEKIRANTEEVVSQGADKIVLGCTHYHWIEDLIKSYAGEKVEVLQPELPVINQLKTTIQQLR